MLISFRPWNVSTDTRTSSFLFFSKRAMSMLSPTPVCSFIWLALRNQLLQFIHYRLAPFQRPLFALRQRQAQFPLQERGLIHPRLPSVHHVRAGHRNALPVAVRSTPINVLERTKPGAP